jgi:hypothetical protein
MLRGSKPAPGGENWRISRCDQVLAGFASEAPTFGTRNVSYTHDSRPPRRVPQGERRASPVPETCVPVTGTRVPATGTGVPATGTGVSTTGTGVSTTETGVPAEGTGVPCVRDERPCERDGCPHGRDACLRHRDGGFRRGQTVRLNRERHARDAGAGGTRPHRFPRGRLQSRGGEGEGGRGGGEATTAAGGLVQRPIQPPSTRRVAPWT